LRNPQNFIDKPTILINSQTPFYLAKYGLFPECRLFTAPIEELIRLNQETRMALQQTVKGAIRYVVQHLSIVLWEEKDE